MKRFIPSDYSLDLFKVKPSHIPTSDWRCQFASVADAERGSVEVVHVLNGGFLEVLFSFLGVIDVEKQTAFVWGDGKQPMEWTTYADTARAPPAQPVGARTGGRSVCLRSMHACHAGSPVLSLGVRNAGRLSALSVGDRASAAAGSVA